MEINLNANHIGFTFHIDLCLNCNEVLQSLASFNYSKCSLHAGPAKEKSAYFSMTTGP